MVPVLIRFAGVLALAILISCNSRNSEANGEAAKPAYTLDANWPQLPEGLMLSQVTGVGIDTGGNVVLFHRAGRQWTEPFPDSTVSGNTILTLDAKTGSLLKSWGANLFVMPHGLTVDKQNNIWVTDVALHQVFKFSPDGKLLLKLGEARKPGNDSAHFNLPTDVAVADDGSFYVSDGYGNSRVARFSKEGYFLFAWGSKGNGEGQFDTPHGIDLDNAGNVYVADRENNRIQQFDPNGRFMKQWKNDSAIQLYSLTIDKSNNHLFAIDYLTILGTIIKGSDILLFDDSLHFQNRFGRSGQYDGPLCRYHDIAADKHGNIYLGDILGNRIQKFIPVNAN